MITMDGEDSISFFTIKNALPLQCSDSNQGIALTLVRREDPENGGPAALVARTASSCYPNGIPILLMNLSQR